MYYGNNSGNSNSNGSGKRRGKNSNSCNSSSKINQNRNLSRCNNSRRKVDNDNKYHMNDSIIGFCHNGGVNNFHRSNSSNNLLTLVPASSTETLLDGSAFSALFNDNTYDDDTESTVLTETLSDSSNEYTSTYSANSMNGSGTTSISTTSDTTTCDNMEECRRQVLGNLYSQILQKNTNNNVSNAMMANGGTSFNPGAVRYSTYPVYNNNSNNSYANDNMMLLMEDEVSSLSDGEEEDDNDGNSICGY